MFLKIKKILIITLLTFIAKSQNTNGTISMDLGVPKGVLGIGYFNIKDNYYGRFEVKFLGNPSNDTYDFSPDVFGEDEDRGKVSNYSALGGGFLYKLKTKQIIHAGILFGFSDQYFKKYNRSDELSSHNIFEWDGLTAREIDAKSNSLIHTHIYDEKSNKIYEKFELQTFEYITTWEWDPKYRQRLLNYTVGPNSFAEGVSISYEWIGNKCIGKNIDGTLSGDSWEVNEFDDRIKYAGRSGRVFIQEYLDERFEPYFTPDI